MDSRLLANVNLLRLLVSFGKYFKNCALYKKIKYLYKTVNSTPEILHNIHYNKKSKYL